jgi:hypothetical protein
MARAGDSRRVSWFTYTSDSFQSFYAARYLSRMRAANAISTRPLPVLFKRASMRSSLVAIHSSPAGEFKWRSWRHDTRYP